MAELEKVDHPSPQPSQSRWPRWSLPERWWGSVAHLVLLVTISVASAFVISPSLYSQHIPELGPEDLGKPFQLRSSLGSSFKAGRDYEIVNRASTEQRRQGARAAVRPVYDYNPSVLGELRQSVHEGFALMQETVAQVEKEASVTKPSEGPSPPPEPAGQVGNKRAKKPEGRASLSDPLLEGRLRSERRAFEQRVHPVTDEDFEALIVARFSRPVEGATVSLIEHAYTLPLAGSRDEILQVGGQGITIRVLGGQTDQLSAIPPAVNDVREAKIELERFASAPGSVLPANLASIQPVAVRLAQRQLRPNLTINTAETELRRNQASDAVKDAVIQIKRGQKVIGDGELISATHLAVLKAMRDQTDPLDKIRIHLGGAGLVALLIAVSYAFHRRAFRRFRPTRKDAVLLGMLLVGMLVLIQLWMSVADAVHDKYGRIPVEALYYLAPIAAGAMLVRFILSAESALFFGLVLSCLAGVMVGNSLPFGIYALVTSLVASERIPYARDRVGIFKAGLVTGVAGLLTVLSFALAEGKGLPVESILNAGCCLVGSTFAVPVMVMAVTPLIEAGFGYASDIKLLELANLNHPALKELIVQAPGTYHHSIIVGSLVEAAAEAIGANPLLARSCAYYHDIGKGRNPLYFGENQKGENRHDRLAPAMSAVIIKRHVTEGLEMARQYKLPKLVADAIPQHHGTRLVAYFYQKALKEQDGKEAPVTVDDSLYRYSGPKPQFREAALVMVADAVEAASRAMPEPSTAKLQTLVEKMINVIFSEGQLEECDLTLKDLNLIAQSFVRTLGGIYHARPTYPPGAIEPARISAPPAEPGKSVTLAVAGKSEPRPEAKRNANR
jgi:putative nucleotidyltransferase with HDIG domain